MSNAINVLQQFSTLSGILAGFSFAAIIQLVSIKEKSELLGASIVLGCNHRLFIRCIQFRLRIAYHKSACK